MQSKPTIRMLDPAEALAGYLPETVRFTYRSEFYFDVDARESAAGFGWNLIKRVANPAIVKEHRWMPFEDHVVSPRGYVALLNDEPVGYAEYAFEEWSNLVRVWHFYVREECRLQGIGKLLMETIELGAKHFKSRGIFLETQSCNAPAIEFYQKCGFTFWGINTAAYTNKDIENKDVFLWMGKKSNS